MRHKKPDPPRPRAAAAAAAVRLNKFLAQAGLGGRRKCDEMIAAGEVAINGTIVRQLGTVIHPLHDRVTVRGRPVAAPDPRTPHVYILLHKPAGVITSLHDPEGRPTVMQLIPDPPPGLKPVGRLDFDTTGLLLLTTDGTLANLLTHPRYEITKTYEVRVSPHPTPAQLARLTRGVPIDRRPAALTDLAILTRNEQSTRLTCTVAEGRNRIVRRLFEALGLRVERLKRTAEGPLRLGTLPVGKCRALSAREARQLHDELRRISGVDSPQR